MTSRQKGPDRSTAWWGMPSFWATFWASSKSFRALQLSRQAGESCWGENRRMVTPAGRYPSCCSSQAATELSTPPLIATAMGSKAAPPIFAQAAGRPVKSTESISHFPPRRNRGRPLGRNRRKKGQCVQTAQTPAAQGRGQNPSRERAGKIPKRGIFHGGKYIWYMRCGKVDKDTRYCVKALDKPIGACYNQRPLTPGRPRPAFLNTREIRDRISSRGA